jgi:hypothetical protein
MSSFQPRHVRPNLIPQRLSPRTGHARSISQILEMLAGHVWVAVTRKARFPWAAIKGPHAYLAKRPLILTSTHFETLSLELWTSSPPSFIKSKHPRRDLSLTLEWPTRSSTQALHRQSPCVRYSWGFVSLNGLGCPRVSKIVVNFRKFVLPSPLWWFDSGNWTRPSWSFGVD